MISLNVDLADRSYPIFIGKDLLGQSQLLAPFVKVGRVLIVTNDVVAPLYLEKLRASLSEIVMTTDADLGLNIDEIILPDGEENKNLEQVNAIYDKLLQGKYDRSTTLIALGGGVVGDITGFAAATYQRGIKFIQIPTTVLAQVDSSVGGKTGVNHALGKNMIGAFHQPQCVLADISVLTTLPPREIKAGLAEVIKYGLIDDAAFFDWLAINRSGILALQEDLLITTIHSCCKKKAELVAKDEREGGVRALLNLGHTFGHAIETASGYGCFLHGEAVAIGMVMAADLSLRMAWISESDAQRIKRVLEEFGLPVCPPAEISERQYMNLMLSDKKAQQGKIRFILLQCIGGAVIEAEIPAEHLLATLTAGDGLCHL